MKRITQIICLLVVVSVMFVNPVFAEDGATWGSNYFHSRLAYLHPTTATTFRVWIEVEATGMMDKLGASEITVQRSSDNTNWTDMATYTKGAFPNLVADNAFAYEAYITHTGSPGYYYRAKVWFYAKKGNGTAESSYTTDSIYVS